MNISENTPKFFFIILATVTLLISATFSAQAHFPWINMEDGTIKTGQNLKWTVGWGHRFPVSGLMDKSNVAEMSIIGPDGAGKMDAEATNDLQFQSSEGLGKPGAYIIGMSRSAGFYTKTTDGHKPQSKKGLENVLSCSKSHSFMKAIANVGSTTGKVDAVVGHEIEIIPLANPAALKVGDFMPFKILYKGKPLSAQFSATYSGFSNETNVFAYSSGTDKDGYGHLKILHSGIWLITVSTEEPFADPEECDVEKYRSALTFEVP